MNSLLAVYLREMMILRRRLGRQLLAMSVSPLLYLLTFGLALGGSVQIYGHAYIEFLIPGLAAMSSMTQAFAMAGEINVARFYLHVFEEFQAAPIPRISYVLGETLAGLTRAMLAIGLVLFLGFLFGVKLHYGLAFWTALGLNAVAFASLAVAMAMLVKSHADQALLNNFIITPMAFLGGTFFPLESLPSWARAILNLLPLSHASQAARNSAFSLATPLSGYIYLTTAVLVFIALAIWSVSKARD